MTQRAWASRTRRCNEASAGSTRVAWWTTPTVDGSLGGGRLHLVRQATAEGALHRTHIRDLTIIEFSQKVRIVSVARIDHHRLDGHTPLPGSIQQPQGNLGLGLLDDLLWHLRLLASLGILGPGLGQKQLGADWKMTRGT